MEKCQDKIKNEKLQKILDKLESIQEKSYIGNRTPKFLDIDITSFLNMSIAERKNFVLNKMKPFDPSPALITYIAMLIESINMKKSNILIIDDAINMAIELQKLIKEKITKQNALDRFILLQSKNSEPKYSYEDIKQFLFSESNIEYHKYLNSLNENLYREIHSEFQANMEVIHTKYKSKIHALELKLKAFQIKYRQKYPNLSFQGKVQNILMKLYNLFENIRKYTYVNHKYQAIGTCNSAKNRISKFLKYNLHPTFSLEEDYNTFVQASNKEFLDVDDVIKKLDHNQWENLTQEKKIEIVNDIESGIQAKTDAKDILEFIKFKHKISEASTNSSDDFGPKLPILNNLPQISEPIIEEYNEDLENSFDFNEIDTSSHRKNSA